MSSHRWGELRTWLESKSLDGSALSDILTPWHEESSEELFEVVLPYVFDHLRQRDEQCVEPRSPAPYSPWLDALLQRAFALDEERDDLQRAERAYRDVLKLKPDCIPAHTNLYRVTHHGHTLPELLDMHTWKVSAADAQSTRIVLDGLLTIDWVGRIMDMDDEYCLFETFELLEARLVHRSTPCSMTIMAIQALLITLDHGMTAPVHIERIAGLLLSMLLHNMFEPYTREDLERSLMGEPSNAFTWPTDKLWSFSDPIILEFESRRDMSRALPDSEERLHVEERSYALYLLEESRRDEAAGPCRLPFFPPAAFERDGRNLIARSLRQVACQMIAAGLPVYRRALSCHERAELRTLEALTWHLGHMAAREQAELRARLDTHELRALSTIV